MRVAVSLIILLITSIGLYAQNRTAPEKISTLSDEAPISEFNGKLNKLVEEMRRRPGTPGGYVAISGKDHSTHQARVDAVKSLIRNRPELKRRLDYTRPGTLYKKAWKETEFWIVPDKLNPPYEARTSDCVCASVSVSGELKIGSHLQTVSYTANVSGGTAQFVTYRWTVKGGEIVKGQRTPSILVRRNREGKESVEVEVTVGGIDEDCEGCANTASFLTIVLSKVPSEF